MKGENSTSIKSANKVLLSDVFSATLQIRRKARRYKYQGRSWMKIECPKCFKENNLNLEAKVTCGHCKEEISGYTYRKPLVSAATALFVGAGGFYAADKFFEERRYPITEEYAIVEACVSSDRKPLSVPKYLKKRLVCVCALDKTQDDYSAGSFLDDRKGFLAAFERNAMECK